MLDIVKHIVSKDPESVIVLCSDHSARGIKAGIDMCQIFNCVYFRGEEMDIEGLSGINTLRIILNNMFGFDYEMIETIPDSPAKEW